MEPTKKEKPGRDAYQSFLQFAGMFAIVDGCRKDIEELAARVPYGLRDLGCLYSLGLKMIRKVSDTFPDRSRQSFFADLKNSRIVCQRNIDVTGKPVEDWCTVPSDAFNTFVAIAHDRCLFCDRRGHAAKECRLYKAMMEAFPWKMGTKTNDKGRCRFADGELFDDDITFEGAEEDE